MTIKHFGAPRSTLRSNWEAFASKMILKAVRKKKVKISEGVTLFRA